MQEMWNQRFAAEEYYYGRHPNPYFQQKIDGLEPGRLLMPAEGEGRNAVYAAGMGWDVTAVDFSEEGRKKALKLAEENNVTIQYRVEDVVQARFIPDHFDVIGLIYFHLYPEIRGSVHKKLARSLKPGGLIILEAFNKKQLRNESGGPKKEEMLYDIKMISNDFSEFQILELAEYHLLLEAGDGHKGHADVIRFFGRK